MQVRAVSWPNQGDRATFRRRALLLGALGVSTISLAVTAAALADEQLLRPLLPLAVGCGLLLLLWVHGAARTAARRAEVEQSFAGLAVLHHGQSFQVASNPFLGEYATRRAAAHAAIDRGSWAIIVRAWDRWFLLAAAPVGTSDRGTTPVSFRSRAVADVVPAIHDEVAASA